MQKHKSKFKILKTFEFYIAILIFALCILNFHPALAQTGFDLQNPLGSQNQSLLDLLQKLIQGLITLAVPLAAGMVVWAGMLYIFGAAKPALVQSATHALTYTVIGFAVLLLSSGVVSIIQDALGVTNQPSCPSGATLCTLNDVVKALTNITGWLFAFALIAGVIMIIMSGLAYVFAQGNTEKAGKAGKMIVYAVIGIIVAGLAWSILSIVSNFFDGGNVGFLNSAYAAPTPSITKPSIFPTGPTTLQAVLEKLTSIAGWLFAFTVVLATAMIVFSGIMYVTSTGESKRVQTATHSIVYAVIGVIVAGLAWSLLNVIGSIVFGAPFFNNSSPAPAPCVPVPGVTKCI